MYDNYKSVIEAKHRYCTILLEQLAKNGFVLKQKKFVRDFQHGKQIIDLSFVSTSGLIHGVGVYYHIIFESAEKVFKKLFGKQWTNWTVHQHLGNLYNNLYDQTTGYYTNKTLNDAAGTFLKDIYPKIRVLSANFATYEQLNLAYNEFPSKYIDCVPSQRFERRILMGLLLTKYFEPQKYESRKAEYLTKFEQFDPIQLGQQRDIIYKGIETLDTLDLKTITL